MHNVVLFSGHCKQAFTSEGQGIQITDGACCDFDTFPIDANAYLQ